ncbi:NAD(P)/FAD-dependent oxidoreductase [Terasakiella pusilla]|uniref:NAD(P)/FAD-dependent oxidoreductase n=1 Tax=Terasakiella pusilla TaxID=64973 RepID=UPI0004906662|nr:FAD-dependent oxidoreductase [Terasakiella pusilla]
MQYDFLIIGAGIHGNSIAFHLAKKGKRVCVLEKDSPSRHSSGVNAGGVRRLGRDLREVPLSLRSAELWYDLKKLIGIDGGFEAVDQIRIAENENELADCESNVRTLSDLGYTHEEIISAAELKKRLPDINCTLAGGIICKGDGFALPYQSTIGFFEAAQRAGATYHSNQEVRHLEKKDGLWHIKTQNHDFKASIVINCAGAWGADLAALIGDSLPLETIAPQIMVTQRLPYFLTPVLGLSGRVLSFKQMRNGTLIIGGGYRGKVRQAENRGIASLPTLAGLADTALDLFPHIKNVNIVRTWCGLEGKTPDGAPIIGPSLSHPDDFYHCFGFCAHGFQLGPACGEVVANILCGEENRIDISQLSASRF